MSWKNEVKNWNGKLYKVLQGNKSCHGGYFEWSLPEGDKPGNWTPIIKNVEMCSRGYHLTTHYAHWSDRDNVSVYEAEGDVVTFDGYDKVVCSRVRLLKLVKDPFNKNNSGYNNSGSCNTGHNNSGNNNFGNRNIGDYNFGDCNSGHNNFGDGNYGSYNSGWYNLGNNNSGNHNSGNHNSGNHNSGNYNSGDFNSGSWNSDDYNSGYFCTRYGFDGIFDKSIPENWKPKFPEWIYFELLPEGYYASWQRAFEDASMEGIKELLDLLNFDYEIFEKITSITKKQIKKKLGE